ncbi:hypothetical protein M2427_002235 [Bradyrhizobium sp. BR13661]|jgi:hypothetical protein|nr:hypothetical protein [Bradyrhizobium sp. BR13661]
MDVTKMVSGGIQIVHRYLLRCSLKADKVWRGHNSALFPALELRNKALTISARSP